MFCKRSFEGKNGKSSLKYQKFLEIFAIYGTPPGSRKNNPFGPNLTSGCPLGSVFWYPLGHNPATGYPARVLFYTPPTLYRAPPKGGDVIDLGMGGNDAMGEVFEPE